eukprot:TRINITY_DN2494_c0_g1_i1.p1 TRINITY_DN2494_c0_g1~~TRINITY_DN2494_c0_g1_i1.p1  ORF type:complete len:238 (-),score=63.94 TRINITY_DN2494_c0_g1_i1:40-753(-)
MSNDREFNVYQAQICEQAERYEDMINAMKSVVTNVSELTLEERNLLSVAYKNVVGARRASWRVISAIQQKEESRGTEYTSLIYNYLQKIEEELVSYCTEIINLIKENLIKEGEPDETYVFYKKMTGDYYRYLAEFSNDSQYSDEAAKAYGEAKAAADKILATTHPIRLGLALNYSVYWYEIANDPEKACKMAQEAFDSAISDLDELTEDSYKDSTVIMQLLKDNLTLWTTDKSYEED